MKYLREKNIKTLIGFVAVFVIFALAQIANAQAAKTNDDRKTECRNLGGTVVEYSDGGFACNLNSYQVTVHCTSGGQCFCTGEQCDKLGDGLGKVVDAKKTILASFPRNVTKKQKAAITRTMDESFKAIKAGNGNLAVKKINEFIQLRQSNGFGGAIECKDRCKHHLDDGNADKYAVCWWGCIIFGVQRAEQRQPYRREEFNKGKI